MGDSRRWGAAVAACLLACAPAAVAQAAPTGATQAQRGRGAPGARTAPARLAVSAVRASSTAVDGGERFVVRGQVVNRGGRAAPAQLALTLEAGRSPRVIYVLRGARIGALGAGRARGFAVRVSAPRLDAARPGGFALRVCARTRRGAAAACASAARRILVGYRAPARPTPSPTPPGPPVTPVTPPRGPPTPTPPPPDPGPAPDTTVYTPGAATLDDPLFPTIGNGGYDAEHYDLDLTYLDFTTRQLRGIATITARATQNLSAFSLDLQGLAVAAVTVDGRAAPFTLDFANAKLVVTLPNGIRSGTAFTTQITYGGAIDRVIDPDGSSEGWVTDPAFGVVALGEPIGSQGWFPVNNVPTDKATFDVALTVPSETTAISNGVLAATTPNDDGSTTYAWESDDLMAPYLATASIGRFDASGSDFSDPDLPLYLYVDETLSNRAAIITRLQRVPSIVDWIEGYYGVPYPFEAAGGIVSRVNVFYALETQTKATYTGSSSAAWGGPQVSTISHEIAHEWFGNFVTLANWKEIWLNEGMAEFTSWLWEAEVDGADPPETIFADVYENETDGFWEMAPADPPTAVDIFNSDATYTRGAMTITAIREILTATPGMGEEAFRALMRDWLTEHANGNGTTAGFIALVKAADPARAARWDEFLTEWLLTSYTGDPRVAGNKPSITPATF